MKGFSLENMKNTTGAQKLQFVTYRVKIQQTTFFAPNSKISSDLFHSFPRREKYWQIAHARGYKNHVKVAITSSFCSRKKIKCEIFCVQKIDNFQNFASLRKNGKLLRKAEYAIRKRIFFWSRNTTNNIGNVAVEKRHDLDQNT